MNAAIPAAGMRPGTGELSAAPRAAIPAPTALTPLPAAGNTVAACQAAPTLTRGPEQLDTTDRKEPS